MLDQQREEFHFHYAPCRRPGALARTRWEAGLLRLGVREPAEAGLSEICLADLPAPRALHWAFKWIRRGIVPQRVVERLEG